MNVQRWEYMVAYPKDGDDINEFLNDYGFLGWDNYHIKGFSYWFKRLVVDPPEPEVKINVETAGAVSVLDSIRNAIDSLFPDLQ